MKTVLFLLYFTGSAVAIPSYSLMYRFGIRGLKNKEKPNFRFLQANSRPTTVPQVLHTEKTLTEKQTETSKPWDNMQLHKTAASFSEGPLELLRSQPQERNASLRDLKMENADTEGHQNRQEESLQAMRDDELQEVPEEVNSVTGSKITSRDRSRNRSRESGNILIRHSGPAVAPNSMETDVGGDVNRGHYPVKRRDIVGYYQDRQEDPDMALNKGWDGDGWKYNKNAIEMFARSKMVEQIVMEEETEEEVEGEEGKEWGGITYQDQTRTAQLNIPEDLHSSDHKDNKQSDDTSRHTNHPFHLTARQEKDTKQTEGNYKHSPPELLEERQLNNSRVIQENHPNAERLRESDEGRLQNSSDPKEPVAREYSAEATYLMAIRVSSPVHVQDESKDYFQAGSEEHDDSYRRRQEAMYQEGERIQSNGQGSLNQEEQQGEMKRGENITLSGTGDPKASTKGLVHFDPDYSEDVLDGSDNKEHNKSMGLKHSIARTTDSENRIKTTSKPYSDGKPNERNTKAPLPDPCRDFYCKTGKVCQEDDEGKLSCVCQDPDSCPSTTKYVCGTDNKTYEDTCQLFGTKCHLEGTKLGHQLHLDYVGACKYVPPCTDHEVEQFPVRMRDWLKNALMRFYKQDLDKGGFLTDKQRNKVKKIYLDEKRLLAGDHPIEILLRDFEKNYRTYTYPMHWHFNRLDQHPTDRKLTHSELAPLRASLVPMEHCVTRFFHGCDGDKDKHISLQEWCHCFGIKEEDIDENLLF